MAILRASVLFLDGPGRREVAGSHVQRRRHCIWPLQQKKAWLTGPFISAEIRPPLFRQHVRDHFVRRVNDHELVVNHREIIWFQRRIIGCHLAWHRLDLDGVRHEGANRGNKARSVLIGRLFAQVVPDSPSLRSR